MGDKKKVKARPLPFPDDWDPKPTVFKGGINRMVEVWNQLRDQNKGGYGQGINQKIGKRKNAWQVPFTDVSSCSPFTATVCGMLFDPSGATKGEYFEPMYDRGTKPLPHDFYSMHQGNYLPARAYYRAGFRQRGWQFCDDPAGSCEFFNLGYPVQGKDLRRGDLVGINWGPRGGHAVFVWDVHLDANGETDAFCYLSANGGWKTDEATKKRTFHGKGVSIGGCDSAFYLSGERGSLSAAKTLFVDREEHIFDAHWHCIPGKTKDDVDTKTFKGKGPRFLIDRHSKKAHYVKSFRALRFWGFNPPDRAGSSPTEVRNFEIAKMEGTSDPPPSFATGKGTPTKVHVERHPVVVHKGPAEKVKEQPPKAAKQHAERPVPQQHWVETALQKLHDAKWLTAHPGDPTNINDAESKRAIKEFQDKFNAPPIDGIAGKITRAALRQALKDLAAGKAPPNEQPKPRKPHLDRVAWLTNRVGVGGLAFLSAHGDHLDLVTTLSIMLRDRKTNHTAKLGWPMMLVDGIGTTPVVFPPEFKNGAEVLASFSGTGSDGTSIRYEHKVPMYIGDVATEPTSEWPWDRSLWTKKMVDIHADLVATPAPTGPFEEFEVTQYYVKEVTPGDVQVKNAAGQVYGTISLKSLMQADIEGTMRLDGRTLNITKAGNVYEPKELIVNGEKVTKRKPNPDKFDPEKSLWTDVTARAPWGTGSKMPLVPYRTLAINPGYNKALYFKKVYIKQLDGIELPNGETHNGVCVIGDAGGMRKTHFDLFVGRKSTHVSLKSVGKKGGTIVEIQVLEESAASKPTKRKK